MYDVYTLMDGDTIESVSDKFGTTKEVIYKLNGNIDEWVSGLDIVVPKSDEDYYFYYTVKKGDYPYEIAKKYGIDYEVLLSLNGLDKGDYIYPNQVLLIPKDDVFAYMTGKNDSVNQLVREYNFDVNDLICQRSDIFLKPEQIILFRKK